MNAQNVTHVKTTRPDLYVFRITQTVTSDDMEYMSSMMNEAFDQHDNKVDLMLIFEGYTGAETGASWNWEALKSRFRSVANIRRYVVVGAPDSAEDMIERLATILPVTAETYDTEIAAWRSLDAKAIAA